MFYSWWFILPFYTSAKYSPLNHCQCPQNGSKYLTGTESKTFKHTDLEIKYVKDRKKGSDRKSNV